MVRIPSAPSNKKHSNKYKNMLHMPKIGICSMFLSAIPTCMMFHNRVGEDEMVLL